MAFTHGLQCDDTWGQSHVACKDEFIVSFHLSGKTDEHGLKSKSY